MTFIMTFLMRSAFAPRRAAVALLAGVALFCPLMVRAQTNAPAPASTPAAAPAPAASGPRKRVAVMDFDFGTVKKWWGQDTWDVGKGISGLLVTALVDNGTLSVIEREKVAMVVENQNLENSKRADASTASQIGKLLGLNAIVTGTVTQFGFEEKSNGFGGIAGAFTKGLIGGSVNMKNTKATVIVNARVIDASTGEVLAVAAGKGESKRGSFSMDALGVGKGGFGAGGVDMGSSHFQDSILGEATKKCVDALALQLVKNADKMPVSHVELIGKIADVDGATLSINIGKVQGIAVGDTLSVEHVIRTVKDPDTGEVIKEVTEKLGTLKITEVEAKSASGTFTGTGKPKNGDRVKN